jgi:P-type Ca2+ transporter type 2C
MHDPLRKGVPEAVKRIRQSGAKVMMITGDSEGTALAIARNAGILDDLATPHSPFEYDLSSGSTTHKTLSGVEIEDIMSQSGLDGLVMMMEDVRVCYRTAPRHKLHIIRALQARGHIVAMTGDGVNDSPALKGSDSIYLTSFLFAH